MFGSIELATAGGTRATRSFSDLTIEVSRAGFSTTDTTDASGAFRVSGLDPGRYLRRAELRGRAAWVRDLSLDLRTPFDTLTSSTGDSANVEWDEINSSFGQRDAYFHATRAYRIVRALDPGPALLPLDQGLELRIEDSSGHCNAYWRGDYFNFTAAGSGCPSTARIADVVYHEYAHAVTQFCYTPFPVSTDLNEGLSDYFAATITNQPRIGIGFRGPSTYLREIETDKVWPLDQNADPHLQGLIIASTLWDIRQSIGAAAADSLFHFARYAAPEEMDDYLLAMLLVDDRNGDLGDGSPHFGPIVNAFMTHGLGDFTVKISADPLTDIEAPPPTIEASATISSLLGLDSDSLGLFYGFDPAGPFARADLLPRDENRTFRAELQAPPLGTNVYYYWAASDTAGHAARLPAGAPAELLHFYVGPDQIAPLLAHQSPRFLAPDVDTLRLAVAVTDNSGRVDSVFAALTLPRGGTVDAALARSAGTTRWTTSIPVSGLMAGDELSYHFTARDQATIPNQARFPDDQELLLQVRAGTSTDFESGPGAFQATGDWQWGQPDSTIGASSGHRAWAMPLQGEYRDATTSSLAWGPLSLAAMDRARLQIHHRYRFEAGFDGGMVEASSNDGATWVPLYPDGGYPYRAVSALDFPGFSGDSGGWRYDEFPLDAFLGHEVLVRFRAASDLYLHARGWGLDDVAVLAVQSKVRPNALIARGGDDSRISLSWQPPVGVDRASSRFLGYQLYRRAADEPWPSSPLLPTPIPALGYIDRDVINGTRYGYRVVAVYDEGESAPLEREATPFAASIELDLTALDFRLQGRAIADTTLFVRNVSGGNLRFNAYIGRRGWTIDQARAVWSRETADSSGATVVLRDARDAGSEPDLSELRVVDRNDPEQGPILEFVLQGWRSWASPTREWGGVLFIDADRDLSSSASAPDFGWDEGINLGWDYAVVFGKLARDLGTSANAVVLKAGDTQYSPLGETFFPDGADSLRFAVPAHLIGDPDRLELGVHFARERTAKSFDRAPEAPNLPWLVRQPRSGRALVDHPQPMAVRIDATTVGNGAYQATLFFETNDRFHPLLEVPIDVRVSGWLPESLEDLQFASTPAGLAVKFQIPEPILPRVARVERALVTDAIWGRVGPDSLFPDSSRTFRFVDSEVEIGAEYLYRFQVLSRNAPYRQYGPFTAIYAPTEVPAFGLQAARPNPARGSVQLRLSLPSSVEVELSVLDVTGRRVLVRPLGRMSAGFQEVTWDGRAEHGTRAPAGVYWLRVKTPTDQATERVVLLR